MERNQLIQQVDDLETTLTINKDIINTLMLELGNSRPDEFKQMWNKFKRENQLLND